MINKKATLIVFVLVLSFALLIPVMGSAQEKKKLEVFHWWAAASEHKAVTAAFDVFTEKNPNVKIVANPVSGGAGVNMRTVLKSLLLAGKPPETFQTHPGAEMNDYIQGDQLATIDGVWTEEIKKAIPDSLEKIAKVDGHYYASILDVHRANVVWYNKGIFEKYDIEEPQTLEEFFQVCEKLETEGVTPIALGDRNKWTDSHVFESLIVSKEGVDFYQKFINGHVEKDSTQLREVLGAFDEFLQYVNEDHASENRAEANADVYNGDAAMTVDGDWANGYFKAQGWKPGEDYGYFVFPGTNGIYDIVIDGFVVAKEADQPQLARKWVQFTLSKDAQRVFNPIKGSIPARTDVSKEPFGKVQRDFMKDFSAPDMIGIPSITHGSATPAGFMSTLNNLLSQFVSRRNIDSTAKSIVNAIEDDLVPNKLKNWDLG